MKLKMENSPRLKIYYLHGFLSSAMSGKAQALKQLFQDEFAEKVEFRIISYPHASPKTSTKVIKASSKNNKNSPPVLWIGSSLGGYYAQYFANKQRNDYVMINPSLNPFDLLEDYLGSHLNKNTGEIVFIDKKYAKQLKKYDVEIPNRKLNSLMLFDEADEVVDLRFARGKYHQKHKHKTIVYSGGSHDFEHLDDAWPEIKRMALEVMARSSE